MFKTTAGEALAVSRSDTLMLHIFPTDLSSPGLHFSQSDVLSHRKNVQFFTLLLVMPS